MSLENARTLIKRLSENDAISQWLTVANPLHIARLIAIHKCFEMTLNVPGHIAEFGVWKGNNLLYLAKLLKLYCEYSHKVVIGFDNWNGLQNFSDEDGDSRIAGEYSGGNPEFIMAACELYDQQGYVKLVTGDIEQSLPKYLKSHPHYIFSLVYIDVDLYAPTKIVLENIWPKLSHGGIVIFDEGIEDSQPGEGAAANEFFNGRSDYEIGTFPFCRQPSFWTKKL